jgi:hypothetical protein
MMMTPDITFICLGVEKFIFLTCMDFFLAFFFEFQFKKKWKITLQQEKKRI